MYGDVDVIVMNIIDRRTFLAGTLNAYTMSSRGGQPSKQRPTHSVHRV